MLLSRHATELHLSSNVRVGARRGARVHPAALPNRRVVGQREHGCHRQVVLRAYRDPTIVGRSREWLQRLGEDLKAACLGSQHQTALSSTVQT